MLVASSKKDTEDLAGLPGELRLVNKASRQ
jgi:hypothetical protein